MNYLLSRSRLLLAALFLLASLLILQGCVSDYEDVDQEDAYSESSEQEDHSEEDDDDEDEEDDDENEDDDTSVEASGADVAMEELTLNFEPAWQIDTDTSELGWKSARLISKDNPHYGVVPVTEGWVDDTGTKGYFVFDMANLTSENERVTGHLKGADFFEVETYPTSTFMITAIEDLDNGQKQVTGDLTIKGVTEELVFETSSWSEKEGVLMAEAAFQVDRVKWGIEYDSGSIFDGLGDKAIADEIDYELKVVLNQM